MPSLALHVSFGLLLVAAAPVHADSARDALKRFADKVTTFQAHFDQVQTDDHGNITNRSSGEFWLSRPGKFRWAYEKPYAQLTVTDGQALWSYDPDLNQATVRAAQTALTGTPAELLSQRVHLESSFTIEDAGRDGDARLVRLLPKFQDSDFKSIDLSIGDNGAPQRMHFYSQIGTASEISFSEIKLNEPIAADEFQFTPPKDTEIVNADGGPKTRALGN